MICVMGHSRNKTHAVLRYYKIYILSWYNIVILVELFCCYSVYIFILEHETNQILLFNQDSRGHDLIINVPLFHVLSKSQYDFVFVKPPSSSFSPCPLKKCRNYTNPKFAHKISWLKLIYIPTLISQGF